MRALACAVALASILPLLGSCGGRSPSEEPPVAIELAEDIAPGEEIQEPPEEVGLRQLERHVRTQPFAGDLDAILERGYLRVLVPYNKTFFFYDGAQARGAAYEFMEAFGEHLRRGQRGKPIKITMVFLPVPRDRLISGVAEGFGDIAVAGLTATPSRLAQVDFVTHPGQEISEVVVTGVASPPLRSLEDLSGQRVFVRPSSSYFESLTALNARLRTAGKPEVEIVPADENLEVEDILELVRSGVEPMTVVDDYLARFWADVMDGLTVRDDLVVRASGRIGPVIRKDSPKFTAALREFGKTHGIGTSFGNVVVKRYFESNRWARNPNAGADRKRFERTVPLFLKYGKEFEFDALLLAAQGYQESQLDQSVRSRAGAVGVMQIKPSTAAGAPIRIRGVETDVEKNIHAGVKYLRHLSDDYFNDPGITPLDRHLFSIASYNAGPNRIQQLRRKAEAQGLDPNVWFRNVELMSARYVGRENVEYVRNILKYWVAYRTTVDRDATALGGIAKPS